MNFPISAEPPSINRIMPIITPNNLLLTSRGRVVYGLMTIDKYNDSVNEYISDEFRQFLYGRKVNYNESDIEKVIFHFLPPQLLLTSFTLKFMVLFSPFIHVHTHKAYSTIAAFICHADE